MVKSMKKLIISLLSLLVILTVTSIILFVSLMPKKLSKDLDKLGDFDDVKIYLHEESTEEKHYLDHNEGNIYHEVLSMLDTIEYKVYSKNKLVDPAYIGEYTITLEGDITIYINASYIIVDGNNQTVKEYTSDTIYKVIDLLISSESIEVLDENFNQ
jgi:hypothetical protein